MYNDTYRIKLHIFILTLLMIIFLVVGCSESETIDTQEISDSTTMTPDIFVSELSTLLSTQIGNDEEITNITLENEILSIFVELSNSQPKVGTLHNLADNRVSSITDEILNHEDFDTYWNIIVIDFGDIGTQTCNKSMIQDDGYGRYFDIPIESLLTQN